MKVLDKGALVTVLAVSAGLLSGCGTLQNVHPIAIPSKNVVQGEATKDYSTGALSSLQTWQKPAEIENITFFEGDQKAHHLQDYKGRIVVLYFWATWLAPAAHDMPTLANLQKRYEHKDVCIFPLSMDIPSQTADADFFMKQNSPLGSYFVQDFEVLNRMKIYSLPVTIILDRQGREIARVEGSTNWDTPEVISFLDHLLSE